ncbi:MAG: hypothetical protein ACFFBP_19475 [Promethearchaeota archaeon]
MKNYSSLYDSHFELPPEEEVEQFYLQRTKQKLSDLLDDSICVCPLCTNSDKDMVYIPEHKSWYCIECQDQERIWYPWHGSEEDRRQNDFVN